MQIDDFVTKCKEILQDSGLKDKQTQTKQQLERCRELQKAVTKLEKKVGKLKKSQEPSPVNRFDERKKDELTRLASFKTQLENIKDTLSPDEVEEDYFRKQKPEEVGKDSSTKQSGKAKPGKEGKGTRVEEVDGDDEDDEEEEDDDDDEEEEDDEDEEEEESDEDVVIAQPKSSGVSSKPGPSSFSSKPKSTGDSSKKVGIVRQDAKEDESSDEDDDEDEDEEYESGEEDEEEGELEEEEEEEEEEEGDELEETGSSEEEDEDDEDDQLPLEGENMFVVLCDFDGEEPTDLTVKQGNVVTILSTREDGWWMAEDEEGNKGMVPSTYLKLKRDSVDYNAVQSPEPEADADENFSPRSGKELWKSVRKSVHETSATDVLSAMGAIPAGFRPSMTAQQNKLSSFLKPKLSPSNLSFSDLLWDPQTSQLRAVPCRLQKMLSLVLVRNMPAMGVGLETKSRHARIAIFDGKEVLSNIHTVQATWNESDLKTWRFSPRVSGILPSILDGECFIRSDKSDKNVGLLIELCVYYVRTKTGEKGELSCGWVHLPLFSEETGGPIINKLYELQVNGGTPFEQGVEVDPSISRKVSTSKLRSMLTANKQPRLHLKLIAPTKEQKTQLETLPFTIVSVASYLPLLSFYRRILADAVLRDRIDIQSTELIHSPLLANFPKAANLPDVMDGLRSMWNEKKRSTKKSEKRDGEQMKALFISAFMESAYPVLYSATLPDYHWPDIESEQVRWESISNFTAASHQKGILTALLSPGKMHTPFHTSEVSFDILGAYTNR
ncbi:putative nephrocystin-1 [Apostichopus japonicus]|uniref:Putative nephrocystin-1 n=1 Tax=Stichopus japonicus TaxID=307972 RepID=A0A2G8L9U0_STIJA|nr:putative nephrocystin-1 [Apostichopus japonicus]